MEVQRARQGLIDIIGEACVKKIEDLVECLRTLKFMAENGVEWG